MYTMLPPIICRSSERENKDEASDGPSALVPVPKACAKPLIAPRDAFEGALFTIMIWIEPEIFHQTPFVSSLKKWRTI